MRDATFREGKSAVEDGFEFAGGDKFEDGGEFGVVAHVGPEDGELAAEEETEIGLGVEASGGAARNQAAAPRETSDTVVPGGGANVFENNVHATFGREAADFIFDFLRVVVDQIVGAKFFCFAQLGVVAR